jgi:glucan phosphoethanolaminetransferase (alkaline phosphatase superfamily)
VVNLLLVVLTKFWKNSYEHTIFISFTPIVCGLVNLLLCFLLLKIMKSEVDLDDPDDIFLSILMVLAIVVPFLYLYKIKINRNKQGYFIIIFLFSDNLF